MRRGVITRARRLELLCVDNYDSFVFNLVDEFARRGCGVAVRRNDVSAAELLELAARIDGPALVLLSPGPGAPARAGCCVELVRRAPPTLPIFGVCLGHQAIVEACGGVVGRAGEVVHGKASAVRHAGAGLFAGIEDPMKVGRYHSLAAAVVPPELAVTARLGELVMAVEHVARPLAGVQFHPESILTPRGGALIDNVVAWAAGARRDGRRSEHA
jgi:anthranilate synthase/aminodeoxychorismate synthase-like glutamine amidotransferase